jgi:starch phosphorylase
MKAAHNGVPSVSILDGWWIEGCLEGLTGWSIGSAEVEECVDEDDARSLYDKLEQEILPMFYGDREGWNLVMRRAIAINASFFNTHRMVQQYVVHAYL